MTAVLPVGFEDLECWLGWSMPTMAQRSARRCSSNMQELQAFYDSMMLRIDDALAYLADVAVGDDQPEDQCLLNLTKSLAEIAPAVELFHEPSISYGYDVARFRVDSE